MRFEKTLCFFYVVVFFYTESFPVMEQTHLPPDSEAEDILPL